MTVQRRTGATTTQLVMARLDPRLSGLDCSGVGIPSIVMRGLDPRIQLLNEAAVSRPLDCRVKPGNDDKRRGRVGAISFESVAMPFAAKGAVAVGLTIIAATLTGQPWVKPDNDESVC